MVLLACCGAVALADDVAAAVADGGASEVDAAVAVVVEDEASLSSAPDVVGVAADVAAASEVAGLGSKMPLPVASPPPPPPSCPRLWVPWPPFALPEPLCPSSLTPSSSSSRTFSV